MRKDEWNPGQRGHRESVEVSGQEGQGGLGGCGVPALIEGPLAVGEAREPASSQGTGGGEAPSVTSTFPEAPLPLV